MFVLEFSKIMYVCIYVCVLEFQELCRCVFI